LAEVVREERKRVLIAAYAAHPERFVKGTPTPAELPHAVWINPPAKKTPHEDGAGSMIVTLDNLGVDPISDFSSPLITAEALH
jgi:hypothetical protein